MSLFTHPVTYLLHIISKSLITLKATVERNGGGECNWSVKLTGALWH